MTTSRLPLQQDCAAPPGRWHLGVFFSLFLFAGCFFLVVMVGADVVVPWRVNHRYRETACVVLDRRVDQQAFSGGGDPAVVGGGGVSLGFRPEILIQYEIGGRTYRTWTYDSPPGRGVRHYGGRADAQAALDGFTVGQVYRCWYDPDEPGEAVLVRGYRHLWWLCFPWPFVLGGGLGLLWLLLTRTARSRREPA
jgi:hypothetical protein